VNKGHLWIGIVIAFLVGNVVATMVLLSEAGDPEGRVLPDYYAKAVAYDDVMAQERASAALGWTATPSLRGEMLEIRVADRAGAPLGGLAVTATVDPRGRTDRTEAVQLDEIAPGVYRGAVRDAPVGLYVVATTAVEGRDTFVATATIDRVGA
jgi:nitrogen fixation protein FixH